MARAHSLNRNKVAGTEAYRRFLMQWRGADQGQPLMVEALAKSK
jgi:hypothetical protein